MVKIIELNSYDELPWDEMVMFDSIDDLDGKDGVAYHVKDSSVYYYVEAEEEKPQEYYDSSYEQALSDEEYFRGVE